MSDEQTEKMIKLFRYISDTDPERLTHVTVYTSPFYRRKNEEEYRQRVTHLESLVAKKRRDMEPNWFYGGLQEILVVGDCLELKTLFQRMKGDYTSFSWGHMYGTLNSSSDDLVFFIVYRPPRDQSRLGYVGLYSELALEGKRKIYKELLNPTEPAKAI